MRGQTKRGSRRTVGTSHGQPAWLQLTLSQNPEELTCFTACWTLWVFSANVCGRFWVWNKRLSQWVWSSRSIKALLTPDDENLLLYVKVNSLTSQTHTHTQTGCKRSAQHLWRLCCNQHVDNPVSAPFFLFTFIPWGGLSREPQLGCVSTGQQPTGQLFSDLISEKFLLQILKASCSGEGRPVLNAACSQLCQELSTRLRHSASLKMSDLNNNPNKEKKKF